MGIPEVTFPTFFPGFSSAISLSPAFLAIILVALFVFWAVYSVILRFHWTEYTIQKIDALRLSVPYFIGSIILFAGLILFLFAYMAGL